MWYCHLINSSDQRERRFTNGAVAPIGMQRPYVAPFGTGGTLNTNKIKNFHGKWDSVRLEYRVMIMFCDPFRAGRNPR